MTLLSKTSKLSEEINLLKNPAQPAYSCKFCKSAVFLLQDREQLSTQRVLHSVYMPDFSRAHLFTRDYCICWNIQSVVLTDSPNPHYYRSTCSVCLTLSEKCLTKANDLNVGHLSEFSRQIFSNVMFFQIFGGNRENMK